MSKHIEGPDTSTAWALAADYLRTRPDAECSNLAVSIASAASERGEIRHELDTFIRAARARGKRIPDIDTVRDTIFQTSFYRPNAKDPEEHLYGMESRIRAAVRRAPGNRNGTYFERLVAYPGAQGGVNQLRRVVDRLRSAARNGRRNGNQYELALYHPEKDPYPVGFPCLSHISITLRGGVLDATAVYRNQYFLARAYGNFLGIGAVMTFLAAESGFSVGELLCVASHARLEADGFGQERVRALVDRCTELASGAGQ